MKVLVCGGRDYTRHDKVWPALDQWCNLLGITEVVHGAATGADTLAGEWARMNGIKETPVEIEPGEGGFARNIRMLETTLPEAVIHFPGGNGTAHMVGIATEAGVRVWPGLRPDLWCLPVGLGLFDGIS